MPVRQGVSRRAREDRCSPRSVLRGTVRMTALHWPSRTARGWLPRARRRSWHPRRLWRARRWRCVYRSRCPGLSLGCLHRRRGARRRCSRSLRQRRCGWPDALGTIAASGRTAPSESMLGTCRMPLPVSAGRRERGRPPWALGRGGGDAERHGRCVEATPRGGRCQQGRGSQQVPCVGAWPLGLLKLSCTSELLG